MAPLDDRAAVRRLLDRFGLGPRPGELAAAQEAGFDRTLSGLLEPAPDRGAQATPAPELGAEPERGGKRDRAAKQAAKQRLREQSAAITGWWLDRMVAADAPLAERMTWFWHGHFATSNQKVGSARLMLAQNATMRRLGTGEFGPLAEAMVVDPAMLVWLDGQKNKVGAANENLAREFMELFTLGVGNYTEQDVRAGARALTGWRVNRQAISATQVAKQHDTDAKTVLGHTGDLDAAGFVGVLLDQPALARFIAGRMWFRLVSSTRPADDAAGARLAAGLGDRLDIAGLLRALATDAGFRDQANTVVKQPVEWLVGLLRAVGVRPAALPAKDRTAMVVALRGMGQVPFLPPSVGGWPAGQSWLTTSAGLARLRLAQLVARHAVLDPLSGAGDPVDGAATMLGVPGWTGRTRAALGAVADNPRHLLAVAAVAPEYVVSP